jgi:hypothetical protein
MEDWDSDNFVVPVLCLSSNETSSQSRKCSEVDTIASDPAIPIISEIKQERDRRIYSQEEIIALKPTKAKSRKSSLIRGNGLFNGTMQSSKSNLDEVNSRLDEKAHVTLPQDLQSTESRPDTMEAQKLYAYSKEEILALKPAKGTFQKLTLMGRIEEIHHESGGSTDSDDKSSRTSAQNVKTHYSVRRIPKYSKKVDLHVIEDYHGFSRQDINNLEQRRLMIAVRQFIDAMPELRTVLPNCNWRRTILKRN